MPQASKAELNRTDELASQGHGQLLETEDRLVLIFESYNKINPNFNTRIETIPIERISRNGPYQKAVLPKANLGQDATGINEGLNRTDEIASKNMAGNSKLEERMV